MYNTDMRIRRARLEDSVELARLHRSTIRHVNSADYDINVIEGWANRSTAKKFRDFHTKSIRIVAVENEKIIGFGEIIKENGNLGAMYVHKEYIGKGVGTKIMERLEKEAVKLHVHKWEFAASVTSMPFYKARGCTVTKKIKHKLHSGALMDAYTMKKEF